MGSVSGKLRKHPTSGALLLPPERRLARCACCGDECLYAIHAIPCWIETDSEDCHPLNANGLWFCADSRCDGSAETIGNAKTSTFFYGGECYTTVPSSIKAVSKLTEDELALLQPYTVTLDCSVDCADAGCGGDDVPNVCPCLCASYKLDDSLDCCMSRMVWVTDHYEAPWSFEYEHWQEGYIERTAIGTGGPSGNCVEDDCVNNRACYWYRQDRRLGTPATPQEQQGCTKEVPWEVQVSIHRLCSASDPHPPPPGPGPYVYCGGSNSGSLAWTAGGTLTVAPPNTIAYRNEAVLDTRATSSNGCLEGSLITETEEGTCSKWYLRRVEETWSNSGGETCQCQEYQRFTYYTEIRYFPATDTITERMCAQCAITSAP